MSCFLQAMRDMQKSGLVLSTPGSRFRDNSLWDSRLLLSIVNRAFPCLVEKGTRERLKRLQPAENKLFGGKIPGLTKALRDGDQVIIHLLF